MATETRFLVERKHGEKLIKTYPLFAQRHVADRVAQFASEKYPAHVVTVTPIEVEVSEPAPSEPVADPFARTKSRPLTPSSGWAR